MKNLTTEEIQKIINKILNNLIKIPGFIVYGFYDRDKNLNRNIRSITITSFFSNSYEVVKRPDFTIFFENDYLLVFQGNHKHKPGIDFFLFGYSFYTEQFHTEYWHEYFEGR